MSRKKEKIPFSPKAKVRFELLTAHEVEEIHEKTIWVLENIGVRVDSEEAVEILKKAGGTVIRDDQGAIVKYTRKMIEAALEAVPENRTIYARNPEKDYEAIDGNVGFSTFGECVKAFDVDTRELHSCTAKDLADNVKICDAMDNIVVVARCCSDLSVTPGLQALYNLKIMMKNSAKPLYICGVNRGNVKKMIEMAKAALPDPEQFSKRPFVIFSVCPTSPLRLGKDCSEMIIECAQQHVPIALMVMALSGATAPVTMAGTVVDHNAEILASLVLAQATNPGTLCLYSTMTTIMDLKHTIAPTSCAEQMMYNACATQMARKYNMPTWLGDGVSDSKGVDAQAGYEYGMGGMIGALAGGNIIYGAGALESGLTIDCAKLVMDCEAQMVMRKVLQGIEVSEETVPLEVMQKVGVAGSYLMEMHTRNHMNEQSEAFVFDRHCRAGWEKEGSLDATEAAYQKAREIIKNHQVYPLPEGAEEKWEQLIQERKEEIERE